MITKEIDVTTLVEKKQSNSFRNWVGMDSITNRNVMLDTEIYAHLISQPRFSSNYQNNYDGRVQPNALGTVCGDELDLCS